MGILNTLANKIEPTDAELKAAGKLPDFSRVARLTLQATEVPAIKSLLKPGRPETTLKGLKQLDGQALAYFTDGSLRTMKRRLTRKEKKALKRRRHA